MSTSTLVRHDRTLLDELVTRMGLAPVEPQLRLEEYDEDGRHVVRADVPGVDPQKDLQVTVEHGLLRVRGERRSEEHDARRSEIRYGIFERVIGLPAGTRADDITAEYAQGVLTVSMPAAGPEPTTTIPITHAENGT